MSQAQASSQPYLSHEERTAADFRDTSLHRVIIDRITSVNERIKIFRLAIKDRQKGVNFLPGQWLDVHVPGIEKAGGFTLTSTPREALPESADVSLTSENARVPYLELAVQDSPSNPPAAWLWQTPQKVLGTTLTVRVGGSFVWPPPKLDLSEVKRVVFIAGGVGVNPLISILSHVHQTGSQFDDICFLYSSKLPSNNSKSTEVLFLSRLLDIFSPSGNHPRSSSGCLDLFITGTWDNSLLRISHLQSLFGASGTLPTVSVSSGRISDTDLLKAAGSCPFERSSSVYYVCGPPQMTDYTVQFLRGQDGVSADHVLCEKWW
ncbi:hypothetical protein GQ43DRAFT_368808 [Delitschia confertaspora ATCC 74209]|uniref:FAD-binding FR-type domain-containing protein n=1 Tax=Delitschia confertaspora ATCC 74209 TaxID=1513339 RepID=A0A9P4JP19_9PLEO|nr:hypothetical protein GQ43DRAFT_368808 [Delitschia confertaspora ATCC 74209]